MLYEQPMILSLRSLRDEENGEQIVNVVPTSCLRHYVPQSRTGAAVSWELNRKGVTQHHGHSLLCLLSVFFHA